jgi:hypothetical protein
MLPLPPLAVARRTPALWFHQKGALPNEAAASTAGGDSRCRGPAGKPHQAVGQHPASTALLDHPERPRQPVPGPSKRTSAKPPSPHPACNRHPAPPPPPPACNKQPTQRRGPTKRHDDHSLRLFSAQSSVICPIVGLIAAVVATNPWRAYSQHLSESVISSLFESHTTFPGRQTHGVCDAPPAWHRFRCGEQQRLGSKRVGAIGTAQLLARPGVGSCMPRPHYLGPFAAAKMRNMTLWHSTHLPRNWGWGWACCATPFLRPAHRGPSAHGTPASVADLCRFAASRLVLVRCSRPAALAAVASPARCRSKHGHRTNCTSNCTSAGRLGDEAERRGRARADMLCVCVAA